MYCVGEEGETPKKKKWRAGLQRMNISMDHLALCTPGLTGFSVEIWRYGMGKMYCVGEEGETPKEKKWRAGLQRMNISMDHLALCTPGLTGFSVEIWRLEPAHILLETVVSAAQRFASKG